MPSRTKRSRKKDVRIDLQVGIDHDVPFPYALQVPYSPPGIRQKLDALGITVDDHRLVVATEKGLAQLERSRRFKNAAKNNPELAARVKEIREALKLQPQKKGLVNVALDLSDAIPLLYANFNWWPFKSGERNRFKSVDFYETDAPELTSTSAPTLPANVPAMLTLRVPLTNIKTWDLEILMRYIRTVVKEAIQNRPTLKEAPRMTSIILNERAFLLHCRDEEFQRDLTRYKLHDRDGLTYRQIAYMELKERLGEAVTSRTVPDNIGLEVPGESSVRGSVERFVKAIYLDESYRARRRRIDTSARGADVYSCKKHGRHCPKECPTLQEWLQKIDRMLPTKTTGKLRGQVRFRDGEDSSSNDPEPGPTEYIVTPES